MSDKQQNLGQMPTDAAELRKRAEEQARTMAPVSLSAHPPESIHQMLHELRVHQIELEMQNEELRTAQTQIEAGRERYFDLYDLAPVGYCTLSEKGLILEANLTAAALLGVARSALVKQPISRFILKDDQDIYYLHRKLLFEAGEPQEWELRLVKPGGVLIWAHLTATVAQAEDGTPVCRMVLSDITERKLAEEAFASQNELLTMIMDTSPVGIATVDVEGSITYANYRAEQILGIEKNKITARKYDSPEWSHTDLNGEPLQDEKQPFFIVKTTGKPAYNIQHGITWPDGRSVILSINASPMNDKEGRFAGMVATFEDITKGKRAEAERERLHAQLRQAQKMEAVGRLAGGVAHDFNNMLGVILGYTEMALDQVTAGQSIYKDLHEIQQAAQRSADLTRQLLTFARKQTIAPTVIDINETVEGMLTMLRRLIGEDIDLIWLPGRNLCPVKMDPTQIDQILANLCVNARDAIEDVGKITIETSLASLDEVWCAVHSGVVPGEYVLLAVSDNGCGMDQETINHLFEPFFSTKEQGKGTGLGLASVYGAVTQNKGCINVYSEPGQGTTLKIYLPRHMIKTESLQIQIPAEAAPRGHETILLVEDEPAILEMTTIMLERQGYTVVAAGNTGEAIRLAEEHMGHIDLLMTDVVMPEMNGRDLAGKITSQHPGIKLLFMSGYPANIIAQQGVLGDGVTFIQKPFSKADLAMKLRGVLASG